jgi:hypothetical protein
MTKQPIESLKFERRTEVLLQGPPAPAAGRREIRPDFLPSSPPFLPTLRLTAFLERRVIKKRAKMFTTLS